MSSAKNVFGCVWSHVCTMSLTSSSFWNQHPRDTSLSCPKIWLSDGMKSGLYAGQEGSSNFSFWIVLIDAAAIWGWTLSWSKTTLSAFLCVYCEEWVSAALQAYYSTVHQHHFAGRRHTFEFLCPGWWRVSTPCFDICLQVHNDAPTFQHLWQNAAAKPLLFHNKGKVKLPLCFFNWSPRHDGVLREWRYSSMHSWPRYQMEVSGHLHTIAALPPGKETLVPIG